MPHLKYSDIKILDYVLSNHGVIKIIFFPCLMSIFQYLRYDFKLQHFRTTYITVSVLDTNICI